MEEVLWSLSLSPPSRFRFFFFFFRSSAALQNKGQVLVYHEVSRATNDRRGSTEDLADEGGKVLVG